MKLLKEFAIIFAISLAGEIISSLLPITIPAAIVALFILLFLLILKVIKPQDLELSGNWLLSNMAILFVPACVSIIEHTDLLLSSWWQILVISTLSFFFTFIASGYTVMLVQKLMKKKEDKDVSKANL